ncbi:E-selectin-like isoform X1 [Halichondria panicea]|uniref:E-selectin-like isoform X1 n=1 Tax=Halichondria panicea TaxID=6063 RepID=UPI00312BB09F
MKCLHLLHVCLVAVGLLVMCSSAQDRMCTSTETFLESYSEPEVYSYRCGWWKWRRCHATRYITKHRTAERHIPHCCNEYTGTHPNCIKIQCPSLRSSVNGKVAVSSRYLNGFGTYSCDYGYKLVGSSSVKCKRDQTWSGTAPSCQRVRCPSLRSPGNGNVAVNKYYLDGTGTYSCHYGFRLDGSSSVRCKSDQTWSGTAPSCQRIRCPSL